jgi:[acyl-carrier-protein] S-malonyltransferase
MPISEFITSSQSTAYLFPGQGSQHIGMAADVVGQYPAARAAFEEADDLLGFSMSDLCFDGPEEALTDTINAQPAILTASIAILRAIESALDGVEWPSEPESSVSLAGHSMGEYSALVASGSISFADGLLLVRERGRLMKEAGERSPGMMAAILGLNEEAVAAVCADVSAEGGIAQVANDNCPGQVVISGDRQGMEAAMEALPGAGARKVVPLAVSIAAHSPLMAPAAAELQAAIDATVVEAPRVPVIGNTTARPISTADEIRAELTAQLTGSVRWTESMGYALDAGTTSFVEIGPGDVLTGLMKRINRKSARRAVNDPESISAFVDSLAAIRL